MSYFLQYPASPDKILIKGDRFNYTTIIAKEEQWPLRPYRSCACLKSEILSLFHVNLNSFLF